VNPPLNVILINGTVYLRQSILSMKSCKKQPGYCNNPSSPSVRLAGNVDLKTQLISAPRSARSMENHPRNSGLTQIEK